MEIIVLIFLGILYGIAEAFFPTFIPDIVKWAWPIISAFTVGYILIQFDLILLSQIFFTTGFIGEIVWIIHRLLKSKKNKHINIQ